MKIALLRHGMTAGNKMRQYIGATDVPLCEEGIVLAESLRGVPSVPGQFGRSTSQASAIVSTTDVNVSPTFVNPVSVFVTPLLRTRQTAAILFPGAKQIVAGGLREMDFGIFEGRTADEMAGDADYRAWVDGGCKGVCPGGEGMEGFRDRVCTAFAEIVRQSSASTGDSCLTFVVHGGVIMAILSTFANEKKQYYDYFVHNCCGYLCDCNIENAGDFADSYLVENGGEKKSPKTILLTNLTPIKGSQWNWDFSSQLDSEDDVASSAISDFFR